MHADHIVAIRKIANSTPMKFDFSSDSGTNINNNTLMVEILKNIEYIKNKLNKIEKRLDNMQLSNNITSTSDSNKIENTNITKQLRVEKEFIPNIDMASGDNIQIKTNKKTSNLSLDDSLNALNKINLQG